MPCSMFTTPSCTMATKFWLDSENTSGSDFTTSSNHSKISSFEDPLLQRAHIEHPSHLEQTHNFHGGLSNFCDRSDGSVTPNFKTKIGCSSYVSPESNCHTYGQNYSKSDKPMSRSEYIITSVVSCYKKTKHDSLSRNTATPQA
jgi:hypothetical protein